MPLSKEQIVPELLVACPELQSAWDKHLAWWMADESNEAPGDYTNAQEFVVALLESFEKGGVEYFPRFFAFVEKLITEGDEETKNIAVVGYLETLQTMASWRPYGPEVFVKWMLPESLRWWFQIHKWWEGGKSLMDIAIKEARQSEGQK